MQKERDKVKGIYMHVLKDALLEGNTIRRRGIDRSLVKSLKRLSMNRREIGLKSVKSVRLELFFYFFKLAN